MPSTSPPLVRPKSRRWAATLNLILPGAGLFYLGRRRAGGILAALFLVCLAAALGIFLVGYAHYLNVVLGGDLMKEGELEQLADTFHKRWLISLLFVGVALEIISMLLLSRVQRKG